MSPARPPAGLRLPPREVAWFLQEVVAARTRVLRPGQIERVRQQRLRRVLAAASRTALYRPHISASGAAAGALDDVPPVTKQTFVERLADTITDAGLSERALLRFVRDEDRAGTLLNDEYLVAVTSGTTGQVGIFVNNLESWSMTRGLTFARIFQHALRKRDTLRSLVRGKTRMTFVVANRGHFMSALLAMRVPALGRLFVTPQVLSIDMPLGAIVDELNRTRPHLLHSYATVLELLAAEQRRGALRIAPDVITSGSEPLTLSCRAALLDAFPGAKLVETYAATECVPMATSCSHGHLHVNEDACILEPADADGHPVTKGGVSSTVLVTNLLNTAQPLVRYVLTDQLEFLDGQCECKSPFGRVRVHGRTDDTIFLRGGDDMWQAHPPIPFEILFLRVPGLLQYQLQHIRQNNLKVLFVTEKGGSASRVASFVDDKMGQYLREHGLYDEVTYTLEQVAEIPRQERGHKMRQIISHVPKPYAAYESAQRVRERRHGRTEA